MKLVLATKPVILDILFSISVTFELNEALVSKPVILDILYPRSVIFVLKSVLLTEYSSICFF